MVWRRKTERGGPETQPSLEGIQRYGNAVRRRMSPPGPVRDRCDRSANIRENTLEKLVTFPRILRLPALKAEIPWQEMNSDECQLAGKAPRNAGVAIYLRFLW